MSYPGEDAAAAELGAWLEAAERAGELPRLVAVLEATLARARSLAPKDAGAADAFPGRYGMVGVGASMAKLFALIERVAPSDVPVLVQGETGSGKELVARALHTASHRADQPFLAENCAAVAATLLESELFGHVRGAFTDAARDRDGAFVAADGGTLFLDEIGDMPVEMQAKILRVLQEGEVRPVGSNKARKVDVRIVAASHRDLAAMVATGAFREDLYYRLNVVTLSLPALRERPEDLEPLARFLLGRIAAESKEPARELTADGVAALAGREWPGNVRELENLLRRAVALSPPGTALGPAELG
ncbi:MAG: sigma-54 dependent transcriptional regulator [Planctomycetota bacterium]|nr:sigma-54 dependent transcriptional regulator [Planctomycetota bacterium]